MSSKPKKSEEKKYSLSSEEKANLEGRGHMANYVLSLIHADRERYVNEVVKKRLSISQDKLVRINSATGEVVVEEPVKEEKRGK